MSRRLALAVALSLLAGVTGCVRDDAGRPAPADVVGTWFDQTAQAVQAQGAVPDPVVTRTWALAWWAADRAAERVGAGGVAGDRAVGDRAVGDRAVDTAVAAAVHDVLVVLVPKRRAELDRALADSAPGDSPDAAAVGRREAAAVLAEREGDGLTSAQVNRPYALPPPTPGTYRPTPPGRSPPQQAGQGRARPFLLTSTAEVDPGPPPALDSATYVRDLEEVRRLGERTGSARTAEQTAVAQFWAPSLVGLLTPAVRVALDGLPTRAAADLLSDLHRVSLDAQLAGYRAKYAYLRWRPVSAIGSAWTPLLDTPPSPDWPSGHTVYAAALAAVLEPRVGPTALTLTSGGVTRRYTDWQQLVDENVDARVWAGVHVRGADVAGAELGRRVAELDLSRLAQ